MEKHIENLNMECNRWKDESNELSLKCTTYESQLEQRQLEYKQQLFIKEVLQIFKRILIDKVCYLCREYWRSKIYILSSKLIF